MVKGKNKQTEFYVYNSCYNITLQYDVVLL